jgi:hypothetical protein
VGEAEEIFNTLKSIGDSVQFASSVQTNPEFIKQIQSVRAEWQKLEQSKIVYEKDILPLKHKTMALLKEWIPDYKPPQTSQMRNGFFSLSEMISSENNEAENLFDPGLILTTNFFKTTSNDFSNLLDVYRKPVQEVVLICDTNPKTKVQKWKTILVTLKEAEWIAKNLKEAQFPSNRRVWLIRPQGEESWPGPFLFDFKEIRGNPQVMRQLTQALFYAGNVHFLSLSPWIDSLRLWVTSLSEKQRKAAKSLFEKDLLRGNNLEKYLSSNLSKIWDVKD